ncbi:MAG TPA: hypothetical protein VGB95_01305 [Chitinophagales bacterium]
MKKVVLAASVLVASASFVLAKQEGKHHGKVEQGAEKAWDKTKDGTRKAWDSTKVGTHRAWDSTKAGSGRAWDKTKDAFHKDGNGSK